MGSLRETLKERSFSIMQGRHSFIYSVTSYLGGKARTVINKCGKDARRSFLLEGDLQSSLESTSSSNPTIPSGQGSCHKEVPGLPKALQHCSLLLPRGDNAND